MLALIAGQGKLPGLLAGKADLVASLDGFLPDGITPDRVFRLEGLGGFLAELSEMGVREACFAGAIRRPNVDVDAIEPTTLPLVPRIMQALQSGDDAALRIVLDIFEEAGITIRAAHELAPDLLPPEGVLTTCQPDPQGETDAARAIQTLDALGTADIGQACVVLNGQVLSAEGSFGTDWMLDSLTRRPDGSGGLLCKAPKPQQDRRADLPAIGPATIARASAARLDGVVIEAGGVMILERAATIAAADAAGLFLWVRPR